MAPTWKLEAEMRVAVGKKRAMSPIWMLMMLEAEVRVAVGEEEEEDAAVKTILVGMLMLVVVVKEERAQENVQGKLKSEKEVRGKGM